MVRLRTILGILAAALYCTWPLGLLFNPAVADSQLASQLEDPGQPFNWLFIGGDVGSGLLLIAVGTGQLFLYSHYRLSRWATTSYMVFGALVATAALTPLDCNPQTASCGPLVHHPLVIFHGFASIASVLFLLSSVVVMGLTAYRRRLQATARAFMAISVGWLIFGIGSLLDMSLHFSGNKLQYFFITLCSVSVVIVIATIEYLAINRQRLQL